MGNLHLVTGYAGREHVTSADQGAFHVAMFGNSQAVLDRGNKLSASIVTNNQVRVLDGEIYMQGRFIRLNEGTYVDLVIENGAQGYKRNDLIVARYTKDVRTGVEDCNLVVIKGTNAASNPSDPAYTDGDLIEDHAILNDMPLYRVALSGLVTESVTPLFSVLKDIPDRLTGVENNVKNNYATKKHKSQHAIGGGDVLSPADIGAVPTTRKVNGKALSADVTLTADLISVLSATATAFGLSSGATIEAVLDKLKNSVFYQNGNVTDVLGSKIDMGASVLLGTYTGTGTAGSTGPCALTFGSRPKFLLVMGEGYSCAFVGGCAKGYGAKHGAPGLVNVEQAVTWAEDGLSWYVAGAHTSSGSYDINGGAVYQLNLNGRTYYYMAIC